MANPGLISPKEMALLTDPTIPQWVAANLVVGADGSTSINERSKGLSSPNDRSRFHRLRTFTDCILIGGQSARQEPYHLITMPLFVLSRSQVLPPNLAMKSNAHLLNIQSDTSTTFESAIQQIKDMGYSKVLVEGGRNFLNSLIDEDLLDIFFLTKTESSPHENVMPLSRLFSDLARNGLIQFSAQKSGTDTFYIYVRSSFTHLTTQ